MNPYQITNGIFIELEQEIFLICMETQKIPDNQSKPEKEKRTRGIRFPDFRLYYKIQKYRPVEQDTKSRNKPMHLQSINVQRRQEYTMEKKQSFH